ERYRNLVELSPDVIMTFDFKGIVTSVNPAIERLSGFSQDEILGKHFSKLGYFRLQDIPRFTRIVSSIVRGKIPSPIEFPYVHKDGTPKWAEAHAGYDYERGRRIGIHTVVMDITDRKIVEEELKEHAFSLEELVKRRSQELVEAEMMVTAGKMASMVGHDLRAPLSNIKNSLYLIERKPEMLEKLKPLIFNSVDYALNMLEELRLITRTAEPTLMETNLGNLVRRAVDEAQIPKEVEVETQIGEGLASAQLDRTQIRRVLDNLIKNAVEAMPKGGTLVLSLDAEEGDIILNVEDTGDGIPEEDMPNIFTPFYTTKSNGMGLGLAYCKRAVESHGGAITWVSKIGVGTTFTVKLPLNPD
ncbi:MAG: PAS domain S-box protein, partial [Candidatus Thermoplasmatota archaeon]|nr:PAS domain S-box protein [Candidatus Thermoplasmatota archaeon]